MTDAEPLPGGNMGGARRRGDTVERTAGPWTPAVHHLLGYLEQIRYPAPRPVGYDAHHEVLTYIHGDVVHPDHRNLVEDEEALAAVFRQIRQLHDALAHYQPPPGAQWRTHGADPSSAPEIVCHNDLGAHNLVHTSDGEWVFIDWDLAAPGRRLWDLSWALLTFIPLHAESALNLDDVGGRLRAALVAYGLPGDVWDQVLDVVIDRAHIAAQRIVEGAARGEEPWRTLQETGHDLLWSRSRDVALEQRGAWLHAALDGLGHDQA